MPSGDDRKRMNARFKQARSKYHDAAAAARGQVEASGSVVQQGGANESYSSFGGGSCAMVCGQVCGMCGQVCGMCGQVCGMCGQVCGMCGQVCGMCGQVCGMCGACSMCGCCGGTSSGGDRPLKVILVQEEQPVVSTAASDSTETPPSNPA